MHRAVLVPVRLWRRRKATRQHPRAALLLDALGGQPCDAERQPNTGNQPARDAASKSASSATTEPIRSTRRTSTRNQWPVPAHDLADLLCGRRGCKRPIAGRATKARRGRGRHKREGRATAQHRHQRDYRKTIHAAPKIARMTITASGVAMLIPPIVQGRRHELDAPRRSPNCNNEP
ncbi:hypothetical protein D3C87_1245300 [compost metagenome]